MNRTIAFVLLCCIHVNGLQEFEERRRFHDWLCQKRPSLPSCSTSYTPATFKHETAAHGDKSGLSKQARAMGIKNTVRRDSWLEDSGEDDDYEYYLWRKYRRQKLRRRLLENSGDSSPESVQYHYHNYGNPNSGYYRPSYYPGYSYPSYGYGGGYPYYGSGYGGYGGGYGGYGGGYGGGLLGGLFRIGGGRQFGISTPIGGFGYSSGFGIGIG